MCEVAGDLPEKTKIVLILGLIGRIGCGKASLCQILERHNFKIVEREDKFESNLAKQAIQLKKDGKSLSDIADELKEIVIKRQADLRQDYIKDCELLLKDWQVPSVINQINCLEQIDYLQSKRNFIHFVSLDTPLLSRYSYFSKKHSLVVNDFSLELFAVLDDVIAYGQDINSMVAKTKVTIKNYGSLQDLDVEVAKNHKKIFRNFKPTWDEYFMKLAVEVKKRSSCCKRSVGAVLVTKDFRILSTGYNGTPYGIKDCYQGGCLRCISNVGQGKDLMECKCIHAEDNCILDVGVRHCREVGGTVLYTTLFPCKWCAKVIVQSGVSKLVYMEDFDGNKSEVIFKELAEEGKFQIQIVKQTLSDYVY